MSKRKINQDYFKLRGNEPRHASDVIADLNRQQYAEARAREKHTEAPLLTRAAGAAPVLAKAPPPPPAEPEPEVRRFPESAVREKRNDPRDGAQDLEVEFREGEGIQTSVKMGVHSSAKKMRAARHKGGPTPSASPVPGAFGREKTAEGE